MSDGDVMTGYTSDRHHGGMQRGWQLMDDSA